MPKYKQQRDHCSPLRPFRPREAIRPIRVIRIIRSNLPFLLPALAAVEIVAKDLDLPRHRSPK